MMLCEQIISMQEIQETYLDLEALVHLNKAFTFFDCYIIK